MEVLVPEHPGVPEGCIVSIRCGGTRRQAPLEVARSQALKFPSQLDLLTEPLKIDVLQPVASSRLVLHPTQDSYLMNFWDRPDMALGLHVSSSSGSKSPPSPDEGTAEEPRPTSATGPVSARDYLELHGVLKYVQSMLTALIQTRPQDPYLFMLHQLKSVRAYVAPTRASEEPAPAPVKVPQGEKSCHESRPMRARELLQMGHERSESRSGSPRDPEESRSRLQRVLLLASRNGAWQGALQNVFKTATCSCQEGGDSCCPGSCSHSMDAMAIEEFRARGRINELRHRVRQSIYDAWHTGQLHGALKEALEESRTAQSLMPGQSPHLLEEAQKVIRTLQVDMADMSRQREELHGEVDRLKQQLREVLLENRQLSGAK